MDACFRVQDVNAQYDSYKIANDDGVKWVFIEDTGKLWSLQELKCGFLAWSNKLDIGLAKFYSDLYLSASPIILALIRDFSRDAKDGGFSNLRKLIASNRTLLRNALNELDYSPSLESNLSVDFARIPEKYNAKRFYNLCLEKGVHLLPGEPFYWQNVKQGSQYIRFSLARDEDELRKGVEIVKSILEKQN